MKKYLSLILALILCLSCVSLPVLAEPDPSAKSTAAPTEKPEVKSKLVDSLEKPKCRAAVVMDAQTGEVLYDFNGEEKNYPASITKIMTALLVLEAIDRGELGLEQVITASTSFDYDLSIYGSTQNIQPGEQLTVHELLYCMLVASANESCNILAEAVAGNVPAFIEKMNERAKELGLIGTHFVNAHGLHDPNHYTTAQDIAVLTRLALQNETFAEIVKTRSHTVPATNLTKERRFSSTNALISPIYEGKYTYSKAIGVKTGTTSDAGKCLVSAAANKGSTVICVVLGATDVELEDGGKQRYVFSESKRLLQWGLENFKRTTLLDVNVPVKELPVSLSADTTVIALKPQENLEATLPNDVDPKDFQRDIVTYYESLEAPIEAGQVLGEMTVRNGSKVYGTVKLVAAASAERNELLHKVNEAKHFFANPMVKLALIILGVLILLLILRFTLFKPRKGYRRR